MKNIDLTLYIMIYDVKNFRYFILKSMCVCVKK